MIILANDLRRTLREVERERSLIGTEIVDVKNQFLGKILGFTPDNPANARVDL